MDIEELHSRKKTAETELSIIISETINDFFRETGYCPSAIRVSLVDVTDLGDTRRRYILSNVEMKIDTGL